MKIQAWHRRLGFVLAIFCIPFGIGYFFHEHSWWLNWLDGFAIMMTAVVAIIIITAVVVWIVEG